MGPEGDRDEAPRQCPPPPFGYLPPCDGGGMIRGQVVFATMVPFCGTTLAPGRTIGLASPSITI